MTDGPDLQAINEQFRARMEAWAKELAEGYDEPTVIASAAEAARRQGIPVVRGEMVAGIVVLEIATPAGHG